MASLASGPKWRRPNRFTLDFNRDLKLKAELEKHARANHRSVNAEILHRLAESTGYVPPKPKMSPAKRKSSAPEPKPVKHKPCSECLAPDSRPGDHHLATCPAFTLDRLETP